MNETAHTAAPLKKDNRRLSIVCFGPVHQLGVVNRKGGYTAAVNLFWAAHSKQNCANMEEEEKG